jgi:hypothetical protein
MASVVRVPLFDGLEKCMKPTLKKLGEHVRAATCLPELNVLLFALLLNYPWEFTQVPLFEGMAQAPHWIAVKTCTRAALADAFIMLIAYWIVAAMSRARAWIEAPRGRHILLMIIVGTTVTVLIEQLVLHGRWFGGWRYSSAMPVIPLLGVGLAPIMQWILLPPLVVVLVKRQIRGGRADSVATAR